MPNQDPLEIPVPGDEELSKMDAVTAAAMQANMVHAVQGLTFVIEQGREAHLAGIVGSREALSHRIIGESGGGQTRSQQAAGAGGTPT